MKKLLELEIYDTVKEIYFLKGIYFIVGGEDIMGTCEKLEKCPFYQGKMDINSGIGLMYKKKYCEGDKMTCARYIIATKLGPEFVTEHIYPNMNELANRMIAEHKK